MSESLHQLLGAMHAERDHTWEPAMLKALNNQRRILVEESDYDAFIKAGDQVEPFELLKVEGGTLSLDELLVDGPAVLVFFRFAGCPASNITLAYYQRNLYPALRELGIPLVAISPQVPEMLIEIKTRHNLALQVVSDKDNALARRFGIVYSADENSRQLMRAKGSSLGELTGTGTWELPLTSVIVIGQDRKVHFSVVRPDWLVASEAQPVIDAVVALTEASKGR